MALTRAFLKGLDLTDEQVSKIITAHAETVDGLKEVNEGLTAELKKAQEETSKANGNGLDWEAKYKEATQQLEDLKAQHAKEKELGAKRDAYTSLLKKSGVSEKRIPAILKLIDVDTVELDENGHIKDEKAVVESIKTDWSDFITETSQKGEDVATPPKNSSSGMTKAQIMEIKDTKERQQAIADNPQAFGL